MIFANGSIWAMEPAALDELVAQMSNAEVLLAIQQGLTAKDTAKDTDEKSTPGYALVDGVAHIDIKGPLVQGIDDWLAAFFGLADPDIIRGLVDKAAADEGVRAIRLHVDSPGGFIDGIAALASSVYKARADKPVTAQVENMAASAAYWVAAQAHDIEAGRTDAVGSIGVYAVLVDSSKAASDRGLKVKVVRTDDLKGTGLPGTEVTKEQLAAFQDNIDRIFDVFKSDLRRGRGGLIDDKALRGRVWIGAQALEMGLVDSITDNPAAETAQEEDDMGDESKELAAQVSRLEAEGQQRAAERDKEKKAAAEVLAELAQAKLDIAARDEQVARQAEKAEAKEQELAQARGDTLIAKAEAGGLKGRLYGDDGKLNSIGQQAYRDPQLFADLVKDLAGGQPTPPREPLGEGGPHELTTGQAVRGRVEQAVKEGTSLHEALAAEINVINFAEAFGRGEQEV